MAYPKGKKLPTKEEEDARLKKNRAEYEAKQTEWDKKKTLQGALRHTPARFSN